MFVFGAVIDPYGHFGNMPEVPGENRGEQREPDDLMLEGCLRLSCVLCAMIFGLLIVAFVSLFM
jgi:hypothetical protein